jgi:hypothetical protein
MKEIHEMGPLSQDETVFMKRFGDRAHVLVKRQNS